MADLTPGSTLRIEMPSPTLTITAPGVVRSIWLKEGPVGPAGNDGFLIAVADEPPDLPEGGIYYDTDDPGIDGSEFIMRVVHNGVSYPTRPPVVYVEWVGPTAPTDSIDGDTWIETA